MRISTLLVMLIPLAVSAQHLDPRPWFLAPAPNVRTVTITGLYETKKDKPDTAFQQVDHYNEDERMGSRTYRSVLDGALYNTRVTYGYWDYGRMVVRYYVNGVLTDTADVRYHDATMWHLGSGTVYEFHNDSVQETIMLKGKTEVRPKRFIAFKKDSFWDYRNAGTFERKTISGGQATDTTRYWSQSDECLVMVVNHYSESRHNMLSEYYNYGVKIFEFKRLRYNENLDITYYLEKSKQGKPSYTISRKFDERGLLTEERFNGAQDKRGVLVLKYSYEFDLE
ncbi:MAG TPA: hypothetical protein VK826_02640 [Bacteroidia bacterium]|nr:hypothetical protein [Bacteroidia bacterium]